VPAAAVIPAPLAYIKVVAVKKLVVGSVYRTAGSLLAAFNWSVRTSCRWVSARAGARASLRASLNRVARWAGTFTLNKFECSKQATRRLKTVCME
jgi:hypothetical protein